jgi:glyoxylase-like metal-dependent hydrolase (beta-lactamase superfamily II)
LEISQGVHLVPSVRWSRIYLIEDQKLVLVDTGMPWSWRQVMKYIQQIDRRPEDLSTILMTHSHPDHTSGALNIVRRTGARIAAHSLDTRNHSVQGVSFGYMGVFNGLNVPVPFLQRTPVDQVMEEGEVLPVLGGIRVVHTPGHTPGSVCYLLEDRGVMFSGDTIFSDGRRVSRSIPFPGYNGLLYRQSLEKLACMQFDTLCGGHGLPLVGNASDMLRELLAARPEPPTWGDFIFRRIPRRLTHARGFSCED